MKNPHDFRDTRTLAVHGIGPRVTHGDLQIEFPNASVVTIARRGGSAFIRYDRSEECKKDFLQSENVHVKDSRVHVCFGHKFSTPRSGRDNFR